MFRGIFNKLLVKSFKVVKWKGYYRDLEIGE